MTHHDTGSDFFIRAARAETAPRVHKQHPSDDALLALLSGDLADEQRSRLHAHLATCSECHKQWRSLETHVSEETNSLQERSTAPTFALAIRNHQVAHKQSLTWWQTLFESLRLGTSGSMALAGSAAVMVLAFVVVIPLFQSSLRQARSQIETLTFENTILQNQVQLNGPFNGSISNAFQGEDITGELLLAYDWEELEQYISLPGDTWETIAEDQLGHESLWPLLWTLNRGLVPIGEPIPAGMYLIIPPRLEE